MSAEPKQDESQPEEIELTPEQEADLDKAWDKIRAEQAKEKKDLPRDEHGKELAKPDRDSMTDQELAAALFLLEMPRDEDGNYVDEEAARAGAAEIMADEGEESEESSNEPDEAKGIFAPITKRRGDNLSDCSRDEHGHCFAKPKDEQDDDKRKRDEENPTEVEDVPDVEGVVEPKKPHHPESHHKSRDEHGRGVEK